MDEQETFNKENETNIIQMLLQKYFPYWPLFILSVISCVIIAYIFERSKPRIFVAAAKVLLKDPNKSGPDSKLMEQLNIFGEKKNVENEILVLKSADNFIQVVKRLNLYAVVHVKGRVRSQEVYGRDMPVLFEALNPDSIISSESYPFEVYPNKQEINIDGKRVRFNSIITLNNTIYRIKENKDFIKDHLGKSYSVQFYNVEDAANNIILNLSAAATSKTSSVVDLRIETESKQKGIDILNSLFNRYNENSISDKNLTAAKTMAFIEDRLNIVIGQLDSVERSVQDYRTKNKVIDLTAQGRYYLQSVQEYEKEKSQIDIQLDVIRDIGNYINGKGTQGASPSLLLINDPTLNSLVLRLSEAEGKLNTLKSISGEKSEALIVAEEEVAKLRSSLKENINNTKQSLQSAKQNLVSKIGQNSSQLNLIPQNERGLLEISRQREIKNAIYTYLLQKREETALSFASTIPDLRVIESSIGYGPIKPEPMFYIISGFVIGLLIPIGFIWFKDQVNNKLLSKSEIEAKTTIPIVAEIVQSLSEDPIVIADGKRTVIAEQIRSMRSNLSFIGLNEEHKTLLITSTISGEGKSFIAVNLAISITLTGKTVALLELDLRKPKITNLLKVEKLPGISNYLVKHSTLEDILKPTSFDNLTILPAGPIPPNPTELISSDGFQTLLEDLKLRYDYIIIDTAPVGPVIDAQLISKHVDVTLYVLRQSYTPKSVLNMIEGLRKSNKLKNLCLVFNGIKKRGFASGSYSYGSSGYGAYGYGSSYYIDETPKKGFMSRLKNFFKRS